jgi:PIN domain nuclease of toxin-antitoxin system
MSVYVTDTHPLVWFTLNKSSQLSEKARYVFESAEAGQSFVYVPAIVLWETALLERAGKIKLNDGFLRWAQKILANSGFGLAPLDAEIIALGAGYNFNGDPFDETITAYAANLDVPLITKDMAISNAGLVEIYW